MRYQWDLLPEVAGLIAGGRPEAVRMRLDALLAEIRSSSPPGLPVFRLRCAVVMSSWVRAARAAGADSSWLLADHMRALVRLAGASSHAGIRRVLLRYLGGLERAVRRSGESLQERLVREIREDMALTIAAPRTLPHYARAVGVSPGHLSRLFTRLAGASFSSIQSGIRHACVVELLLTTELTLAGIGKRVGLRSASQLIAAFRQREGVTPAKFRHRRRSPRACPGVRVR